MSLFIESRRHDWRTVTHWKRKVWELRSFEGWEGVWCHIWETHTQTTWYESISNRLLMIAIDVPWSTTPINSSIFYDSRSRLCQKVWHLEQWQTTIGKITDSNSNFLCIRSVQLTFTCLSLSKCHTLHIFHTHIIFVACKKINKFIE